MLRYKEKFEVDVSSVTSSIDQVNGEYISTKDVIDTDEPSRKLLFQSLELFIYFGWPLIVSYLLLVVFPSIGLLSAVTIFILMVSWPWIKGKIGTRIALRKNIKDPRLAIRSSSFWSDGFLFYGSPLTRDIRQYSALSRSLDCIYNITSRFGIESANFKGAWWEKISSISFVNVAIKNWTLFWSKMPISQDVRTRLSLVSSEIERMVTNIHNNNIQDGMARTIRIVLLAGGTKQDVIMASASLIKKIPDIKLEVVCVEPDGRFAIRRSMDLIKHFELPQDVFIDVFERVYVEPENKQTLKDVLNSKGYVFEDFDLVVCIGLGDYMYGDKIYQFVKMLDNGQKLITANISSNLIERIFMHVFLQWPKMQYLSIKKYKKILVKTLGIHRKITIYRTPNKVFNIAVVE